MAADHEKRAEIVFVTPRIHTGEIRSETFELLLKTRSAAGTSYAKVSEFENRFGGMVRIHPAVLRRIVNPNSLTYDLRRDWRRREIRVSGFLRDTRLLERPTQDITNTLNQGFNQDLPPFPRAEDALGFWAFAKTQTDSMLQAVDGNCNSLRMLLNAYVESRIVRAAIYEGVYLSRL